MYIIVAGGGMVGGTLAKRLIEDKHDVVLIDADPEVCNKVYAQTGVVAITGSAKRIEVLKEAGLDKADIVVAATGDDADNLACAVLAKSAGVPRLVVRMRDPNYESAYEVVGIQAVIRTTDLMVNQMLIEIENPAVRKVYTIGRGRANIFMVVVPQDAKVAGMSIKDIAASRDFPSECIFICVYNQEGKTFSIPRGEYVVCGGDELFIISVAENIKEIVEFLTAQKSNGGRTKNQPG